MRNPKQLCKDHNLYSYQAIKGAEMMAQAIAEDILHILNTTNVRPIHERIIEYFGRGATTINAYYESDVCFKHPKVPRDKRWADQKMYYHVSPTNWPCELFKQKNDEKENI